MTAYVTGADRGLGLALCAELLRNDYRVFAGSYLDARQELDRLAATHSEDLLVLPLDVASQRSVDEAAAKVAEATSSLNLLINNAGIAVERSKTLADDLYIEDMRTLMEVNTFGPLRVAKSVLNLLLAATPKTLINISSMAGSVANLTRINQYGYTMSKAALNMQSKLIRNHFGPEGLNVLAVHPGGMPTLILGDPEITKNAPVKPEESARGIVALAGRKWGADEHFFVDYQGSPIPW